jgi:hypothetical protein
MSDQALRMTIDRRSVLAAAASIWATAPSMANVGSPLSFAEFYKNFGVLGYEFSDRVMALRGETVRITGFMAPPLKAESRFFVLTRQPLAICPFCQSDADWPVDIVVVLMRAAKPLVSAGRRIAVTGRLEIGSASDPETGFVSLMRVADAAFRPE